MSNTTTAALPQTSTTTWNIDPAHSIAEFKVKHMMIANVKGQFSRVSELCFWMNLISRTLASRLRSRLPLFTLAMTNAMLT